MSEADLTALKAHLKKSGVFLAESVDFLGQPYRAVVKENRDGIQLGSYIDPYEKLKTDTGYFFVIRLDDSLFIAEPINEFIAKIDEATKRL